MKAIAYKTGYTDSNIATSTFNRITVAATPTFNPASSTGSHPPADLLVSVNTTSPAAQLRWTDDGTNPTTTTGYFINGSSGGIYVRSNEVKTLKAIAYGNGGTATALLASSADRSIKPITRHLPPPRFLARAAPAAPPRRPTFRFTSPPARRAHRCATHSTEPPPRPAL